MKAKLLLLPLMAMSLVGCITSSNTTSASNNQSKRESEPAEEEWVNVLESENVYNHFTVSCGSKSFDYQLENYKLFCYCDRRTTDYMILDVKYVYNSSSADINKPYYATFIGKDVNYAIY